MSTRGLESRLLAAVAVAVAAAAAAAAAAGAAGAAAAAAAGAAAVPPCSWGAKRAKQWRSAAMQRATLLRRAEQVMRQARTPSHEVLCAMTTAYVGLLHTRLLTVDGCRRLRILHH